MSIVVLAMAQLLQAQARSVPVYELAKPETESPERFGNIFHARGLPNGKVLVNDGKKLQVLLLDERLSNPTVVIGGESQVYGQFAAPLIPYRADSTLFTDRISRTLIVIDPNGRVVRAMAPLNAREFIYLSDFPSAADQLGNLVYRARSTNIAATADGKSMPPIVADSVALLRANLETRTLDTLTRYKLQPQLTFTESKDANGKERTKLIQNPWLEVDDWTVLSDGTVAIIRGNDYHVDFIDPDGTLRKSPRLAFDFKALNAEDKQRLVDSATKADSLPVGYLGATKVYGEYVPAASLPDYYPSIRAGAAKADLDANLWILPNTSAQSKSGELVYDVVSNKGELLYRVRMPVGKSIAGFGKNGVVYLMSKDGNGWLLERTRVLKTRS